MNFAIRQAKPSDADSISRLVTEWALRDLGDPTSPEAVAYLNTLTPSAIAERIEAPSFRYYVARNSTGLCGVIAMHDSSRIYHLFVASRMHGKGVARALWEHAKTQSGRSTFIVNSSLSAVPVYERFGFVATAGRQKKKSGLEFVPMEYTHDS